MFAEANGRVTPSQAEAAIYDLLDDGKWHQLSEIAGFKLRTLQDRAKKLEATGKLKCMTANDAKAQGLLAGEVTGNRALAYALPQS